MRFFRIIYAAFCSLTWISFSILFLYSQRAMDTQDTIEAVGFVVPPIEEDSGFPGELLKRVGFSVLVMASAILQYEMIRRNRNAKLKASHQHSGDNSDSDTDLEVIELHHHHHHHDSLLHTALELSAMAPPFAAITAAGVNEEIKSIIRIWVSGNLSPYIEIPILLFSLLCGNATGYGAYIIHTIHANDGEEGPISLRNFLRSLKRAFSSGIEFSVQGFKHLWYKVGVTLGHLCEPFFVSRMILDYLFIPLFNQIYSLDEDSLAYQISWGTLTLLLMLPMLLEINSELRSIRLQRNDNRNFFQRYLSLPALVGYGHALPHVLGIVEAFIFLFEKTIGDLSTFWGPFEATESNETFHHMWILFLASAVALVPNARGFTDMVFEVLDRTRANQPEEVSTGYLAKPWNFFQKYICGTTHASRPDERSYLFSNRRLTLPPP
ncbi:MAG: hypothetical protein JSS53_02550 [Proteobacteria bacterium]|nr:hypothetical protein [Pseudomonadota bacterium]